MTDAQCPSCRTWTGQDGDTEWDDRGPYQQILIRRYVCTEPGCGRRWTLETDGG